ncbi:hypothetical protein CYMTET_36545 [Cymbomonas tetramitiformis]|uniref:Uncharacterized protein n=1 Tax=Cymbomonas tetramitiformis TaxID=36881 RepID=A0AAE0CHZ9_9CHLO|nr:hypothetical protein CYMTET_36545 [Cymbomonas tetramitiformis]
MPPLQLRRAFSIAFFTARRIYGRAVQIGYEPLASCCIVIRACLPIGHGWLAWMSSASSTEVAKHVVLLVSIYIFMLCTKLLLGLMCQEFARRYIMRHERVHKRKTHLR